MRIQKSSAWKPFDAARRLRVLLLPLLSALGIGCATPDAASGGCDTQWKASPQYSATECRFMNLASVDGSMATPQRPQWLRFLTEKRVGTTPVDAIPMRPVTSASLQALDVGENHVIRLGHSSHLLKLQGKYWLIDPIYSERASPLQWAGPKRFHPSPLVLADVPPIEGVILSHDHYDHLDRGTIEALLGRVQRYFVPLGVGARLRGMGVPSDRIEEFDWWKESSFGAVRLVATPARHFSGRTPFDRDSTLWASWVIESGNQKIFFSGDTGYLPGFRQIGEKYGPFDLAMMENGAYDDGWPDVHMSPEDTARAFADVKGKLLYSMHNSTFEMGFHTWQDPMNRIDELSRRQGFALATPEIGEVLTIGKARENRPWWRALE